ncbi:MAG: 2-oxoglutarate dehydrogenase E1 subunit family protein, partial [Mariniblastus sp.]
MNVFSRAYIDSLFDDYQQDPSSLPPEWQTFFESFDPENSEIDFTSLPVASNSSASSPDHNTTNSRSVAQLQDRVDQLIRGFRVRGHLEAKIDPLGRPRATNNELNPESYGLLPSDFPKNFS